MAVLRYNYFVDVQLTNVLLVVDLRYDKVTGERDIGDIPNDGVEALRGSMT